MRGPDGDGDGDGDGPGWGGPRRRPRMEAQAFDRGRRGGRGPNGRDWEGREAVVSLLTALRQVGRVGDDSQRRSARVVIDDAARALWSILAQGPAAPATETVAGPDVDEPSVAADATDETEAGAATDAATDA